MSSSMGLFPRILFVGMDKPDFLGEYQPMHVRMQTLKPRVYSDQILSIFYRMDRVRNAVLGLGKVPLCAASYLAIGAIVATWISPAVGAAILLATGVMSAVSLIYIAKKIVETWMKARSGLREYHESQRPKVDASFYDSPVLII